MALWLLFLLLLWAPSINYRSPCVPSLSLSVSLSFIDHHWATCFLVFFFPETNQNKRVYNSEHSLLSRGCAIRHRATVLIQFACAVNNACVRACVRARHTNTKHILSICVHSMECIERKTKTNFSRILLFSLSLHLDLFSCTFDDVFFNCVLHVLLSFPVCV